MWQICPQDRMYSVKKKQRESHEFRIWEQNLHVSEIEDGLTITWTWQLQVRFEEMLHPQLMTVLWVPRCVFEVSLQESVSTCDDLPESSVIFSATEFRVNIKPIWESGFWSKKSMMNASTILFITAWRVGLRSVCEVLFDESTTKNMWRVIPLRIFFTTRASRFLDDEMIRRQNHHLFFSSSFLFSSSVWRFGSSHVCLKAPSHVWTFFFSSSSSSRR